MLTFLYYLNNVGLLLSLIFLGFGILDNEPLSYMYAMEFLIGLYQMTISLIMIFLRSRTNSLLDYHFILSGIYLLMAIGMAWTDVKFDESFMLGVFPWSFAILFTFGIRKAANKQYESFQQQNIAVED